VAEKPSPNPSYRALLDVPSLGRVLLSMQVSRIAQSMVGIVMILFALQRYNSPQLAGLVAFASIAPGMVVSPIAGALLDRHGRVRLIILDYFVAAAALLLVAGLSLAGSLPAPLLVAITALASLTGPLSGSGLRSLFPLLVPPPLWERVNAVDSNGWVLATVVGAPIGAVAAQILGFEIALGLIASADRFPLPRCLAGPRLHMAQQDAALARHIAFGDEPVQRHDRDRRTPARP
jgi:MFS family permease